MCTRVQHSQGLLRQARPENDSPARATDGWRYRQSRKDPGPSHRGPQLRGTGGEPQAKHIWAPSEWVKFAIVIFVSTMLLMREKARIMSPLPPARVA